MVKNAHKQPKAAFDKKGVKPEQKKTSTDPKCDASVSKSDNPPAKPELIGDKKLLREQEKIRREEEELEKRNKELAAEKLCKKSSGDKGKRKKDNKLQGTPVKNTNRESSDKKSEDVHLLSKPDITETRKIPKHIDSEKMWPEKESSSNDFTPFTEPGNREFENDNYKSKTSRDEHTDKIYSNTRHYKTNTDDMSKYPKDWSSQGSFSKYSNRSDNSSDSKYNRNRGSQNKSFNTNFNYEGRSDSDFNQWKEYKSSDKKLESNVIKELNGDLFSASEKYSLAHCVAEDMSMGAGIAKTFRSKYKNVPYLLNQRAKTGSLAILKDKNRFIYYLVTKEKSYDKPTMYTLWQSLQKLRDHIAHNEVKNLAIPQIGCGLDRLYWPDVKLMLEYIFQDLEIEILVYSLATYGDEEPSQVRKAYVHHVIKPLIDIEVGTALVYLGTENGYEYPEINSLSNKYRNLVNFYKTTSKTAGQVIKTEINKELLYGLIVGKTHKEDFDFECFEMCMKKLKQVLKKDDCWYIGFQAFLHDNDPLIMEKITNVMQYIAYDHNIYICWPNELREYCPANHD